MTVRLKAYSVLSTGIGGRANLIIFDDPQDLRTAVYEPSTRRKIEETIENIWLSRLISGNSEVLVLMNKWSQSDYASIIQKNPFWAWMSLAVNREFTNIIYEDSFGSKKILPLWSKFQKKDYIERKASIQNVRDFERGYMLIPYTTEDMSFPAFESCCHFGIDPKK